MHLSFPAEILFTFFLEMYKTSLENLYVDIGA